mgnify:CR=1 FL=1
MKEYPILFSAEMVRAILSGEKTQTRRVLSVQPPAPHYRFSTNVCSTNSRQEGKHHWVDVRNDPFELVDSSQPCFSCPYGYVGERLWVRETFLEFVDDHIINGNNFAYRADIRSRLSEEMRIDLGYKWSSPLFMPRRASRITLEIKNLRVERVQEISEADAKAEGIISLTKDGEIWKYGLGNHEHLPLLPDWPWTEWQHTARDAYARLWDLINGEKHPWESNPWVWVINFERVK